MLHRVAGDILKTRAQVIVQGVAANDPMDQGLARSLHELFPQMHKDFHRWCHQHHPRPGTAWHWQTPLPDKIIVNLIIRDGGYGHGARPGKARAADLNHALHALRKLARDKGFRSLALPHLATGVGGLEQPEELALVDSQLAELDIPIVIYTDFVAGQKAAEPGIEPA